MSQAIESQPEHWDALIRVAKILHQHRGAENAIPGEELARQIGVSHSTVRNFIPEVIESFRLPVGNNGDGYFVIESHEEFRRLMGQYESRRESARDRMQALSRAFYGEREVWV